MNKNLILLLVILMLSGIGYLGYQKGSQKSDYSELMEDRNFTVDDPDIIHKIKITRRTGKTVELERKGDIWYVGGKRANDNIVKNMLSVFKNAQIKFIPPKQAVSNIITEVNRVGVQIDLYDKNDKHFNSFFIGGNTPHETGTYFLQQNSVKPYVMELPYVEGGLRDYFLHNDDEYLDPYYLRLDADNIRSIQIDYPKDKQESFTITRTDQDQFSVNALYPTTKLIDRKVNNNTVKSYLQEFKALASESIETNGPMAGKLEEKIPFAEIRITFKKGKDKVLIFYPTLQFLNETMGFNENELANLHKISRFFCKTSWGEIYGIQSRLCKEIFVGYSYFFR